MSISIKPLEDRIVVQTAEAEQTTASGLVIPDTAKEKPQEGKVVAVGPGRVDDSGKRVPVDVAEGDVVIYSKYGGTEVNYAGEDYLILSARDVPLNTCAQYACCMCAPRPEECPDVNWERLCCRFPGNRAERQAGSLAKRRACCS